MATLIAIDLIRKWVGTTQDPALWYSLECSPEEPEARQIIV